MISNNIIYRIRHFFSSRDNNNKKLKSAFGSIKKEMEDHLDAINENTNEIQSNYEFMCRLDSKIDKINERLDEMQMFIEHKSKSKDTELLEPLTKREKEVVLVLYSNDGKALTYRDIARRTALTEIMAKHYVINLIKKGVPVIKKADGGEVFVHLDKDFMSLQAKENILGISETIARSIYE